jgi:hypothetical protein
MRRIGRPLARQDHARSRGSRGDRLRRASRPIGDWHARLHGEHDPRRDVASRRYTSTSATSVKIYETEAVELTNTSAARCYLPRPTLMEVSLPFGLENVAGLNVAPQRVDVPPATSVTWEFGSLAECGAFQPPMWASSVTVTFRRGGSFRLDGMHMSILALKSR